MANNNYTGAEIEVLKGLEAVRKRPGMYIGNTAERGLHQLVYEAVDNAVDEALAGHATHIEVTLHKDGSCEVEDDGRGIPVDIHAGEKLPAVEVVMTILHAGGKFGKGGYKVSGGLHGVGISVVNALSEWMTTRVKRDGWLYEMKFIRGITRAEAQEGRARRRHRHDPVVQARHDDVRDARFPLGHLAEALARTGISQSRAGDHAARLARRRTARTPKYTVTRAASSRSSSGLTKRKIRSGPIISTHARARRRRRRSRDAVHRHLQRSQVFAYANNINTIEGGMHLHGFRQAVTTTVNGYARKRGMLKEADTIAIDRTTSWKASRRSSR